MSLTYDPIQEDERLIPAVPSPYEGTKLAVGTHLKISAFWFATNFLWGPMLLLMIPGEMGRLAPYYKAAALGLLTLLSSLAATLVPLVAGALSDRCASKFGRRRPYIVVGVLLNLVGLVAMSAALGLFPPVPQASGNPFLLVLVNPGFLAVLAGYLIVQCGNNIATGAYMGVIPDLVPEDQRGRASGYMALLTQIGTLFGIAAVAILGIAHQPEWMKYGVVGVALVGIGAITVFGIKENPLEFAPPKIDWAHYLRSLWIDPRKYPDFAWVWLTRALVMLGFYAILPFINYYLGDVIRVPNVDDSVMKVFGLVLLASSISGLIGGYVADKVGRKKVVYVANCVMALTSLSFIACHNLEQVLAAAMVFGLAYGTYISVDWALGTDVLPSRKDAGKEMAVWHVAMTLPQAVAPVAGYLVALPGITTEHKHGELLTHYASTGYAYLFVFCAVSFTLGAFFLRNVKSVR